MQLHDLSRDMRSQGTVVVREIGKVVGGHRNPLGMKVKITGVEHLASYD